MYPLNPIEMALNVYIILGITYIFTVLNLSVQELVWSLLILVLFYVLQDFIIVFGYGSCYAYL